MADGPNYRVPFRRRREGRTDYRQRQRLLRARVPRAVVRTSLKSVTVQIIAYTEKGDEIITAANSRELVKIGWTANAGNIPAAYLTGYLAGKRAKKLDVERAVLDIGLREPAKGASCFAALRGLLDAGIDVPHGDDVLPSDDRIAGKHINESIEKMVEEVKGHMEAD